jgi:hypothetical protein
MHGHDMMAAYIAYHLPLITLCSLINLLINDRPSIYSSQQRQYSMAILI